MLHNSCIGFTESGLLCLVVFFFNLVAMRKKTNTLGGIQQQSGVLISLLEVFVFRMVSPVLRGSRWDTRVWREGNASLPGCPATGKDVDTREKCLGEEKSHPKVSCFHSRFLRHSVCLPIAISSPSDGPRRCPHITGCAPSRTRGCSHLPWTWTCLTQRLRASCTVLSPTSRFSRPTPRAHRGGDAGGTRLAAPTPAALRAADGPSVHLPQVLLRVLDSIINLRGTYGDRSVSTWSLRSFSPPIWFIGRELG